MKEILKKIIDEDIFENGIDILIDKNQKNDFTNILDAKAVKKASLENLKKNYKNCKNCNLFTTRKNVIFGEGDANAKIMIIIEAPLEEEDTADKTFVGEKSVLFTKMLEAIAIKREAIFLTNVVKCFPHNIENQKKIYRTPTRKELDSCREIWEKELKIIKPKLIITMGNTSLKTLLGENANVLEMRGKKLNFKNIPLIPIFHPAYLLREIGSKKLAWEDLKIIRRFLDEYCVQQNLSD